MISTISSKTETQTAMDDKDKILIIDDHEAILAGLIPALDQKFPAAQILKAKSRQHADQLLAKYPNFMLVIVDLSLPEKVGAEAKADVGFELVETLLNQPNAPNILVLSTNPKPLVRLKSKINTYEVLTKSLAICFCILLFGILEPQVRFFFVRESNNTLEEANSVDHPKTLR